MSRRLLLSLLALSLCITPAGCGSKISKANYYRVQYGMTEEEVEDLLGPAHAESAAPVPVTQAATTAPVAGKTKSWSRDGLVIRVTFRDGIVVARSAEGIAAESAEFHPATLPGETARIP